MSITGIENSRAIFAYQAVEQFVSKHYQEQSNEYRSYIKKMPMMIKTNGLGQTLAFYYSQKDKAAYEAVYDNIDLYLKKNQQRLQLSDEQCQMELVKMVIQLSSRDYRLLTMELMALLNWMRRFVEGKIKENTDGGQ